jgi:hypothetical protein
MNDQEMIYGCDHCRAPLFAVKLPVRAITIPVKNLCETCYQELYEAAWRYKELSK